MPKASQLLQRRMAVRSLVFILSIGLLAGCATGISRKARNTVTYHGTFSDLHQHPADGIGKTVLLGGKIIAVTTRENFTELAVLQLALDAFNRVQDNDHSEGRFLIVSHTFLDPAIYKKGDRITVVGRVTGTENRLIGQHPYRYLTIAPTEIRHEPPDPVISPRIRFGFGFGATF